MLSILLSLVPYDKPAYLVLDAASKAVLGVLHLELLPTVRYTFQPNNGDKLVAGNMMVNVLEEAFKQPLEVDFTVPQDLIHST